MKTLFLIFLGLFLSFGTFAEDNSKCDLKGGGASLSYPHYAAISSDLMLGLFQCELVTPNPNEKCELVTESLTESEYCQHSPARCPFSLIDFLTFYIFKDSNPGSWLYYKISCIYSVSNTTNVDDTTGGEEKQTEQEETVAPPAPNNDKKSDKRNRENKKSNPTGPFPNN